VFHPSAARSTASLLDTADPRSLAGLSASFRRSLPLITLGRVNYAGTSAVVAAAAMAASMDGHFAIR
jgi:hypothetical protein